MLNNVLRRVTLWNQVEPFYPNGKDGPTLATPESRGYRIGAQHLDPGYRTTHRRTI